MAETFDPKKTTLIQRAISLENARKRRVQDVETAKKQIPDLIIALHGFIDSNLPEDSELRMPKPKEDKPKTEEEKAEIMKRLTARSKKAESSSRETFNQCCKKVELVQMQLRLRRKFR